MQLFPFSFEFVCFSDEELCKVYLEAIKYLEVNCTYVRKLTEIICMVHGKPETLKGSVYSNLL